MNIRHAQISLWFCLLAVPAVNADVVADWNVKACDIVFAASATTPVANRALAITQTAVYEAVNRITGRYPQLGRDEEKLTHASVAAAVAAANRATLMTLFPAQREAIDAAYQDALAEIADGGSKTTGVAVGERAAALVRTQRSDDGAEIADSYRPFTTPGRYVPTALPLVSHWPQRKTWNMDSASQFRPGPPPALTSETWARDYNEVKALGAKDASKRTADQTDVARFWETTFPSIYYGVVRSIAERPGREVTRNARLYGAVGQALDDAMIAVFDAKYHFNFWRPVTAIRNGDEDGNDATERDGSWSPLIDTPMHPEYPCAHCILAATVGTVLKAEIGDGENPELWTTSYLVEGSKRSWQSTDDFIREVGEARICDGVHYRTSTEVGAAMGRQIGELAARMHFGARGALTRSGHPF